MAAGRSRLAGPPHGAADLNKRFWSAEFSPPAELLVVAVECVWLYLALLLSIFKEQF